MSKQETASMQSLADRLDEFNRADAILIEVAEALDLKWLGEKPKNLRKKIVKDIAPDHAKDPDLKQARTRVMAHVNRAMDIAKSDGTLNTPMTEMTEPSAKSYQNVDVIIKQYTSADPRKRAGFTTKQKKWYDDENDPYEKLTLGNKIFRSMDKTFSSFSRVMDEIEDLFSYIAQSTLAVFLLALILLLIILAIL